MTWRTRARAVIAPILDAARVEKDEAEANEMEGVT